MSKLVTANVDFDDTLSPIVDAAHQLTRAVSSAITLLDDDDHLAICAGCGPITDALGERVSGDSWRR